METSETKYFRIYGKHKDQKRFKPMDLGKGIQVTNLIYASVMPKDRARILLIEVADGNPDWQFELRAIEEEG